MWVNNDEYCYVCRLRVHVGVSVVSFEFMHKFTGQRLSRGRGSSVTQRTATILAYWGKLDIQTESELIRSSGKSELLDDLY